MGFHNVGSLRIAASEDRATELDAMAADASKWNIPIEWPSMTEVSNMVPWLDTGTIRKVAYLPTDGYADPYLLSMSYIGAARARGAVVRPRTDVCDVLMDGQKVMGVMSEAGQIACGTVIDACGVWAALFSERVSIAFSGSLMENVHS